MQTNTFSNRVTGFLAGDTQTPLKSRVLCAPDGQQGQEDTARDGQSDGQRTGDVFHDEIHKQSDALVVLRGAKRCLEGGRDTLWKKKRRKQTQTR